MPRFALLEHDHPTLHWDLLLEVGAVLWTWRLDAIPCLGIACTARRIADHRSLYLSYEGPVSGDRGTVRRIADGDYERIENGANGLIVRLRGENLSGRVTLTEEQGVEALVSFSPPD